MSGFAPKLFGLPRGPAVSAETLSAVFGPNRPLASLGTDRSLGYSGFGGQGLGRQWLRVYRARGYGSGASP
jgi:hypothetical protein